MRILDFFEERTGLVSALRRLFDEGPRLSSLAIVLVALFTLQAATGVALSFHYAPTTTDAWGSVWYLEHRLPFGSLVRSIHHWGTSALVVAMGLHLFLTAVAGRYRRPREVSWWISVAALFVVLAAALTGNPLRWDQAGYWGLKVEAGIAEGLPVVGPAIAAVLRGGNDLGNLTLTRLHTLHAIVLPAVLGALGALQWRLLSRTPPRFHRDPLPTGAAGAVAAVAAVVALAIVSPAPLEAPAEPASSYQATPAWYFLPLNQLLAILPPELSLVGTALVPGAAVLFLLALPFLDSKEPEAAGLVARPWIGCLGAGGLALLGLLALGLSAEASDEALIASRLDQAADAARAEAIAAAGLPAEGAAAMLANDPLTRGKRLFRQQCAPCHRVGGTGTDEPNGPDLAGYLTEPWLRALIEHPRDPRFFGTTEIDDMDPYAEEDPETLARVVRFVAALRHHPGVEPDELPQELREARAAWDELGCESCHEIAPGVEGAAPNLAGYGSDEWLRAFLRHPEDPLFYGEANEMPAFDPQELSDSDLDAVIAWLRELEKLPLAPQAGAAAVRGKP